MCMKVAMGPRTRPVRVTSVHRSQAEAILIDIVEKFEEFQGENESPSIYVDWKAWPFSAISSGIN